MLKVQPLKSISILLLFFTIFFNASFAQGYSVLVQCPPAITGRLTFTLYSNSPTPFRQRPYIENGETSIAGTLQQPSLLKINHPALPQPLYLFIENANIVVKLNPTSPQSSPVTGSRLNSLYRYALETHNPELQSDWLASLILENKSEIFAPFILSQQAPSIPFSTLNQLFQQLTGDATATYHYQHLKNQIHQLQSTTEGATLPDFVFTDANKHSVHFDSIHSTDRPTILLFSASWCHQCLTIAKQLQTNYPQLHSVVIPIDAHPKEWNAPYLEQLAIERIPYMILIDTDKTILTRDVRIWELPRLLTNFQIPNPTISNQK